jgi:DNA-binding NtrC family response regulator
MPSSILVVSEDLGGLAETLDVLTTAGYRARGASTFEEAKPLLLSLSPEVMIADERLGGFNGLHLILHARALNPQMRAIATTPRRDPVFVAEAGRLDVQCVVKSANPADLLLPIARSLRAPQGPDAWTAA